MSADYMQSMVITCFLIAFVMHFWPIAFEDMAAIIIKAVAAIVIVLIFRFLRGL